MQVCDVQDLTVCLDRYERTTVTHDVSAGALVSSGPAPIPVTPAAVTVPAHGVMGDAVVSNSYSAGGAGAPRRKIEGYEVRMIAPHG